MALTAIHLNQVNATASQTHGTEWLKHARSVVVGLLVGTAMFVAAPFALHAVSVRPATNAQLTSAVTNSLSQFPAVVSTGSTVGQNELAPMGIVTP